MSMMKKNNMNLMGKWDVAVLPKCPDPLERGRTRHDLQRPLLRHRRGWKTPGGGEGFPSALQGPRKDSGFRAFSGAANSGLHRSGVTPESAQLSTSSNTN